MTEAERERRALELVEAALERAPAERNAFVTEAAGGDGTLRDRVLSLLRAEEEVTPLRTGGAATVAAARSVESLPERIGPWRVTGLVGQGGMGAVLRAERAAGDYERTVAIKLIRPGALSELLIERFRRERQVLAGLNHPGVARLYDGGETEAGQPYLVMELVDGEPLDAWLARRPDRAARTALFLGVCRAAAYAHRNLVVHRDLTPSNILVQADGSPKVIDFGIARPPERSEEGARPSPDPSSLAALSLTPGFAAPERESGGATTTLADVYSLGVLLGRVLPAEGDADLAAIATKAAAPHPEDRYPTADALAEDLEAWRDGRPVQARRGGRAYVAGRFLRRHAVASVAAGVGAVLLCAAMVATVVSAREAEAARVLAEKREAQTRAIANTLLFAAYDEVSKVPGATRARELLAREGAKYLDGLAADRSAPVALRVEAGRGYLRLAQATGTGEQASLGDMRGGRAHLARAEALLRQTWRDHPDDPAAAVAWAELLLEQSGHNLYDTNDIAAARRQALEAQTVLQATATADAKRARLYLVAVQAEGDSYGWNDDYARAEPVHGRAEAFAAALPTALQNDPEVMRARAANLRLLAEALNKVDKDDQARAVMDRAVGLNETLLAAAPADPKRMRSTAMAHWYRAVVQLAGDDLKEAETSIARSMALARGLVARDPADAGALRLFAVVTEVGAQVAGEQGRFADSFRLNEELMAAHRRVAALAGRAPGTLRTMAASLKIVGGNYYNGGEYAKACASWTEAQTLLRGLERSGALSELDRANMLPEIEGYRRDHCGPRPLPRTKV